MARKYKRDKSGRFAGGGGGSSSKRKGVKTETYAVLGANRNFKVKLTKKVRLQRIGATVGGAAAGALAGGAVGSLAIPLVGGVAGGVAGGISGGITANTAVKRKQMLSAYGKTKKVGIDSSLRTQLER